MRTMEFSIENNGHMLTVGQTVGVKEYVTSGLYSYMIEHAIGMSKPYPVSERLKSDRGKVLEVKKTARFNIAVLEFEE
ncbi:MAG: hypothetical protein Q4C50_07085 [Eubacteriales bacterium]|nr:hypothetical protein [Eubacteriales bacterium]